MRENFSFYLFECRGEWRGTQIRGGGGGGGIDLFVRIEKNCTLLYEIVSKMASISTGSLTGTETGCDVDRASVLRAGSVFAWMN